MLLNINKQLQNLSKIIPLELTLHADKSLVIAVVSFYAIDELLISHMSFDNTGDKLEYTGRPH